MNTYTNLRSSLKKISTSFVAKEEGIKTATCDLFGGGDGKEYAYDEGTGRWITVHPNGAKEGKGRKIHLDENGKIDSQGPLSEAIKAKEEGSKGNSKPSDVVSQETKPITAFHAGEISIEDYDMDKADDKLGIFFSGKETDHYGKQDEYEIVPKNKLVVHQGEEYQKYLSPRTEEGEKDASDVRKRLLKDGYDCVEIRYAGKGGDVVDFVALDKSIIHKKGEVDKDSGVRKSISDIYTGSAANYDEPSLIHIGSGEGSQVYGWGLYGSNVRGVAEVYKQNGLKGGMLIDGKRIPSWGNTPESLVANQAIGATDLENVRERLVVWKKYCTTPKAIAQAEKALEFFDKNRDRMRVITGNLYSQTFFTNRAPGDESHLLNWYEPVSFANVERIAEQAKKEGFDIDRLSTFWNTPGENHGTGEQLYNALEREMKSPKAVSEFLARADIDGIKYPVDSYGSTDVKDGDTAGWNYVSFRDDNINVDRKWVDGQEVPVANNANKTKAMLSTLKDWIPGIDVGEVDEGEVEKELAENDEGRNGLIDKYINDGNRQGGIRKSLIMGERGAELLSNNENVKALSNLKVAKQMLGDKNWDTMSRDEKVKIKLATGWEKGKDGKWRRESADIPNQDFNKVLGRKTEAFEKLEQEYYRKKKNYEQVMFDPNANEELVKKAKEDSENAHLAMKNYSERFAPSTLKDIIGESHEIIKAYPELANMEIRVATGRDLSDYGRLYFPMGKPVIEISSHLLVDPKLMKNTLTHEIQHAIQTREGFGVGGGVNMFSDVDEMSGDMLKGVKRESAFSQYQRLSGEVEARNASGRTETDRNTIGKELLEDTEDIAREDQVVVSEAENAIRKSIAFANAGTSKQPIKGQGGKVAGWYDRNTGKVRLVKGVATPATVAHEIGWHATFHWAEKHHPELHKKLIQYAKEAPEGIEQSVKEKYGTKLTPNELLDEIGAERFTREDISPLLQDAQKRASEQFFDRVENEQDNLRKAFVGASTTLSRTELDEIAQMEPKKAVETLVQRMLEGRNLGDGGIGGNSVGSHSNNDGKVSGKPKKATGDSICCDLWGGPYEVDV